MSVALRFTVRRSGPDVNHHFRPSGVVGAFVAAGIGIAGGTSNDSTGSSTRPKALSVLSLAADFAVS